MRKLWVVSLSIFFAFATLFINIFIIAMLIKDYDRDWSMVAFAINQTFVLVLWILFIKITYTLIEVFLLRYRAHKNIKSSKKVFGTNYYSDRIFLIPANKECARCRGRSLNFHNAIIISGVMKCDKITCNKCGGSIYEGIQ